MEKIGNTSKMGSCLNGENFKNRENGKIEKMEGNAKIGEIRKINKISYRITRFSTKMNDLYNFISYFRHLEC